MTNLFVFWLGNVIHLISLFFHVIGIAREREREGNGERGGVEVATKDKVLYPLSKFALFKSLKSKLHLCATVATAVATAIATATATATATAIATATATATATAATVTATATAAKKRLHKGQ